MSIQSRFADLKLRSVSLNAQLQSAQRSYTENSEVYKTTLKEYEQAKALSSDLVEAIDRFKLIVEKFSSDHITKIENLVTSGLRTIFFDRQYSLSISISDKRDNKYAEFFLVEGSMRIPLKRSSVAGGILVVVGFILQTYFISYFKLSPVIVTDESFSQLSDEYIPGLMTFMDRLKVHKNFIIILVTHDPRFIPYADRTYLCSSGTFKKLESRGGRDEQKEEIS